jgi:hypothetical protein
VRFLERETTYVAIIKQCLEKSGLEIWMYISSTYSTGTFLSSLRSPFIFPTRSPIDRQDDA